MRRRAFCLGLVGVVTPISAIQVQTKDEKHNTEMGRRRDPLYVAALEIMRQASPFDVAEYPVSLIQRHLRIGYFRAKAIVSDAGRQHLA